VATGSGAGSDQVRNDHQPEDRQERSGLSVPFILLQRADEVIE